MRLTRDHLPDWLSAVAEWGVGYEPRTESETAPLPPPDSEAILQIIIVNYRTADLTINCLGSLAEQFDEAPAFRVTVVDNASGDGSVERLRSVIRREDWEDWVRVLPLEQNAGFASGNNTAIRAALATQPMLRFILLLNPDTVVARGAIAALLQFLEEHPSVGIAGSRLEDDQGRVQCSAHRFPGVLGEWESGARMRLFSKMLKNYRVSPPVRLKTHECEWVSGACMMVRREVFDRIGLLDEKFFLYFEEVDFCHRARKANWRAWYVPAARVVHLEGEATNIHAPQRPRPGYWFDSRRRYFLKNHGWLYAALADAARIGATLLYRLRCRLTGRKNQDPPRFLRDLVRHSVLISDFCKRP